MLLAFLAVATAILSVYSILSDLFLRDRTRFGERVDDEFRKRLREQARKAALFKDRGVLGAEEAGTGERQGVGSAFEGMVEQSGLNLTPGRLLAIMAVAGAILFGVGLLVQGFTVAAVAALVGAL